MVEKNRDYYCLSVRETDLTILADTPWWDTTHSGLQILSELTEKWYLEF